MLRADIKKPTLILIVLAFLLASQPHHAGGQNPWGLIAGFHSVGVGQVDENAVAAVLSSSDDELFALVVYPAVCDGAECVVSDPGAFLLLDRDGSVVKLHIEPGREAICHPIFASVLKGFAVA